eukprot:3888030-Rhodomonas_salina.1
MEARASINGGSAVKNGGRGLTWASVVMLGYMSIPASRYAIEPGTPVRALSTALCLGTAYGDSGERVGRCRILRTEVAEYWGRGVAESAWGDCLSCEGG